MEYEFEFGLSTIRYTVLLSKRKTLSIIVMPDGTVTVKAPDDVCMDRIVEKIRKRASWIIKQQHYFKSFGERTPERKYVSGESHLYLGKQYMLRVTVGKPESVKYKGRYFEIVCSEPSNAKELMKGWYREHAKEKFAQIAEPIILRFEQYSVKPSSLHLQEMSNRWGSCTNSGKIILNTELIKAPRSCIEYVITHELCHLIHREHNAQFFELLATQMPDWERWKNKLERLLM